MTCGGCSGAVTRVLAKKEGALHPPTTVSFVIHTRSLTIHTIHDSKCTGVEKFDVSLEKQEVMVYGTAEYDDILATIKKTGKEVRIKLPTLCSHSKVSISTLVLFSL